MKISVIIPIFNKEKYLARSIRSVLAQTLSDFELILVDDGSRDSSLAVANSFKDPRIQIIHQPNAGPGAARNTGLLAANGELVAFLDADDEWLPEYLADSLHLLSESGPSVAAVISGYYEFPAGVSKEDFWRRRGLENGLVSLTPQTQAKYAMHLLAYMSCWSTVARRSLLLNLGGFFSANRCCYGEDSFLWLKVLLNHSVRIDLTPRVKYHREASGLSRRLQNKPVEPILSHREELLQHCPLDKRPLLEDILVLRRVKRASVLAAFGRFGDALRVISPLLYKPASAGRWVKNVLHIKKGKGRLLENAG